MALSHNLVDGVVVWARHEGFPWWPARICSRYEVMKALEPGAKLPKSSSDELLVWFFNDEDNVAVVHIDHIAEYSSHMRLICLPDRYVDDYRQSIVSACCEAHQWIASARGASFQRRLLPSTRAIVQLVNQLPLRYTNGPWLSTWSPQISPETENNTTVNPTTNVGVGVGAIQPV